jgi:dTDP-4-amino-4,6-dideoxygalactose transaminase
MSSQPFGNSTVSDRKRHIAFVALGQQFESERAELMPRIESVLASGMLILGPEVDRLEEELAAYCGTKYAVTLSSGTAALNLAMEVFGIGDGDEVITPPNSFVSSTSCIVRAGAKPVFADVGSDELIDPAAVEAALTPRTKAIMPVHLRGGVCDMTALKSIAQKHSLLLIEDAAQAIGSALGNVRTGALGDIGCFSAHPLKLLNGSGDCGFVTTNDAGVVAKLKRLRNAGLADRDTVTEWGTVARLDALQAAILRVRLKRLDGVIAARRRNAARYLAELEDVTGLDLPRARPEVFHTYNTFTLKSDSRDALQKVLIDAGVEAKVHYPIPLHLQPVAKVLGYRQGQFPVTERLARTILSVPVHQFLTDDDIDYVATQIRTYSLQERVNP